MEPNARFSSGAAELTEAAKLLRLLMPSLENHNVHTKDLTRRSQAILPLSEQKRIAEFRKMMLEYAELLKPIGEDHDRLMPEFDRTVREAIDKIRMELKTTSSPESNERQKLLSAITDLYKAMQEGRSNIDSFRGTLTKMPSIPGAQRAKEARDKVTQSIRRAVATFQELEKELLQLQSDLAIRDR